MTRSLWLAPLLAAATICPAMAQNVLNYHNGVERHGAYVMPGLTTTAAANMHLDTAFNATVSGNVYAQPLFWTPPGTSTGEVIVATESNIVYALNAITGAVIWQTTLGTPVPLSDLPCGNINPEGITGTPTIQGPTGTLFVDALIDTANGPRQQIFALSATTGKILPKYPLDIQAALAAQGTTFDSTTQGERAGLLFLNGNLYISYAGRSGDCDTYHGVIVQVKTAAASIAGFWQTRANGGGIWAQGGAFSDGTSIFATTGNTMNATSWSDGEAIIKLAPGLAHSTDPTTYFTPANWKTLDNEDLDLGGTDATVLKVPVAGSSPVERLLALGKDGNAYLVDAANLGGIGSQLATLAVSKASIITAAAVYATPNVAMLAFRNGNDPSCNTASITMLSLTATTITQAWCAPLNGGGAPVITTTDGVHNAIVWVVGANGDNFLHGFDALKGTVLFAGGGTVIAGVRNFATILVSGGKFYIAGQGKIYAFTYM